MLGVDCNNQTKDIMNVRTILGGVGYESPACTPVEVSLEGILCASFGNESFKGMGENDTAPSYGSGEENNGWY